MKADKILQSSIMIILSISISMAVAGIVAWMNSYKIAEMNGYFYWFVFTPFCTFVISILLLFIVPDRLIGFQKMAVILIVIVLVSLGGHTWALNNGWIGGWYLLPKGFDTSNKTLEELLQLVDHRNDEIRGGALSELDIRGKPASETLIRIIKSYKETNPKTYIDISTTKNIVEILSTQGDERAIPILKEMLKSEDYNVATYKDGTMKAIFTTRIGAKRMLKKYFTIDVEVETETILGNKSGTNSY